MLCCPPPVPSRRTEGDPAPQPAPWKVQPASPLAGCTLRRRDEMRDAPRSTEGGLSSSGSSGWEGPTGLHCDPPAALINPGSVPADSQGDHKEDAGEIILAYSSGQPAPLRGGRGAEPPCALGVWVQMPSHAGPAPRPDTRWQAWPWDRGDGRALGGGQPDSPPRVGWMVLGGTLQQGAHFSFQRSRHEPGPSASQAWSPPWVGRPPTRL